jgi:hypothetical protein
MRRPHVGRAPAREVAEAEVVDEDDEDVRPRGRARAFGGERRECERPPDAAAPFRNDRLVSAMDIPPLVPVRCASAREV